RPSPAGEAEGRRRGVGRRTHCRARSPNLPPRPGGRRAEPNDPRSGAEKPLDHALKGPAMPKVSLTPKSESAVAPRTPAVKARAQRPLNADRLSSDDIEAIVTLRREPPASCRSLTHERQLRWLGGELAKAIAKLEQSPKIEERAIPKRTADGLLARDSHGQIEYEVRRVPVAQDEVDRIEALLKATRDAYRAELKIGPRRRAALASAEERFL